jgi:hypothetical protein
LDPRGSSFSPPSLQRDHRYLEANQEVLFRNKIVLFRNKTDTERRIRSTIEFQLPHLSRPNVKLFFGLDPRGSSFFRRV